MSWKRLWQRCREGLRALLDTEKDAADPRFVAQVLHGGEHLRRRYAHFKRVVAENDYLLDALAELSQPQGFELQDTSYFVSKVESLLSHALAFVQALNDLSEGRYPWLLELYERLFKEISAALNPLKKAPPPRRFYALEELSQEQVFEVGAKAANLAEARNALGLSTPQGVVVSTRAFQELLRENSLEEFIRERLQGLRLEDTENIARVSKEIQKALLEARLPQGFQEELLRRLENLGSRFWAVRSSALGEDGSVSFAGQFLSLLNIPTAEVPRAYLKVVASLYGECALYYRLARGLQKTSLSMAVLILEMIDARTSGVLYSLNPNRPRAEEMLLSAVWGLGQLAVGGDIHPDIFVIDRRTGHLKEEKIARKTWQVVRGEKGGVEVCEVSPERREESCLKAAEIRRLYQTALLLEEHFKFPQDIEWSIDQKGWLYLLQTRPLQVKVVSEVHRRAERECLCEGQPVSPGVACGLIYWLKSPEALSNFPPQAIAVVPNMNPDWAKLVPRVRGLVALRGGPTTHLATILREARVPALVVSHLDQEMLPDGELVTLDAYAGRLYRGRQEEVLQARYEKALAEPLPRPGNKALERVLELIMPLTLTEISEGEPPAPDAIHTLHDLIRCGHEIAVWEMFSWGEEDLSGIAHVLVSPVVPMVFYVVDLGGGLAPQVAFKKEIKIDHVRSLPFLALWRGMSHPGVRWAGAVPFDFGSFVSVMSRSFVRTRDLTGKAYALVSREYLNFHSRLAYHFAVVDTLCSEEHPVSNYVAFKFQGGGAGLPGRLRRLAVLEQILQALGFRVRKKGDRLQATLRGTTRQETEEALDQLGRLMAYVRQLDMATTCDEDVTRYVKAFLKEDYAVVQR